MKQYENLERAGPVDVPIASGVKRVSEFLLTTLGFLLVYMYLVQSHLSFLSQKDSHSGKNQQQQETSDPQQERRKREKT